jgi:hypothetical protein
VKKYIKKLLAIFLDKNENTNAHKIKRLAKNVIKPDKKKQNKETI